MRNKTYNNFMLVYSILQNYHGYDKGTAERLAHQCFDQAKNDPLKRKVEHFLSLILTREEWEKEYNIQ